MTASNHTCVDNCGIGYCRQKCSLEVVDELLSTPDAVSGEEVDLLLDFRFLLRARRNAEAALRSFCELRRRLEQRHYLAFFRLRRWLEHQLVAEVSSALDSKMAQVPLHLDFYCVEAIRRQHLCIFLQRKEAKPPTRLRFSFIALRDHKLPMVTLLKSKPKVMV